MIKRMIIMLILVSLILAGIFGFIEFKSRMIKQFMGAQGEPPQTVSTITANYEDWLPTLETIGSLRAIQGVELSSEVAGLVTEIYFHQGDTVTANTPLVQLRADDDIAKLKSLRATAELAEITWHRSEAQFKAKAISQQTLDFDKANLTISLANVNAQQAIVNKKTIRAPFNGRLGIRAIDLGQYLNAGTTISSLQNLDNVYVDFYLPQQNLGILKLGQTVNVSSDAYPNQKFRGEIVVVDPKVDPNTRNVLVRATLNNPRHKLVPGMYSKVQLIIGAPERYITLPRSAISFNSYGATVFIIDQNQQKWVARQAFVTTGETRGDQISIIKGVKEGEAVVTSGQIKLHNGTTVLINNSHQPSNDSNPQPIDQ